LELESPISGNLLQVIGKYVTQQLHKLCASPSIITVLKSRKDEMYHA